MKKMYSKPQIQFEDFSLSASIAAGCDVKTNLHTENVCGYIDPNDRDKNVVFTLEVSGCVFKQPDLTDSICYHIPAVNNDLFNS